MQFDQAGHVPLRLLVEAQGAQSFGGHPPADDVVPAERHRAVAFVPARGGLADVVEERGEPQHEVRPRQGAAEEVGLVVAFALQGHGLVEHRQGVLVDVLVPSVLVDGVAEQGEFGQDDVRHARVHKQFDAAARGVGDEEPFDLGADPLGGDDGQAPGHLAHGRHDVLGDVEPQLGGEAGCAHDAQRVVVEGLDGCDGRGQDSVDQLVEPAARVDELDRRKADGHRVDGEVPARQVAFEGVPVVHARLAGADVVGVGPVGRHLDGEIAPDRADRAELASDVPRGRPPGIEEFLGFPGSGGRREIEVVYGQTEEGVPHWAAHECQFMPGICENGSQFIDGSGKGAERLLSLHQQEGAPVRSGHLRHVYRFVCGSHALHPLRVPCRADPGMRTGTPQPL